MECAIGELLVSLKNSTFSDCEPDQSDLMSLIMHFSLVKVYETVLFQMPNYSSQNSTEVPFLV